MSFAPNLSESTNPDLDLLIDIHRYKRPKGSRMEQVFIETFLLPLGVKPDLYGNLHKVVAPKDAEGTYMPSVIWSSHTDTVHTEGGFQRVVSDANGMLSLHKRETANCLGADDGAGVWMLMEMIKAGVPGWYIFHYGEEKGCEGSTKLAEKNPEIFKEIKFAIAFDRRNNFNVITKMNGQVSCSDAFADSLIKQLPVGYAKEPTGAGTDVGKYKRLIPECTNLSVGYLEPHSPRERLDTVHLISLRDHMIKIDPSKFEVKRDPKVVEYNSTHCGGHGGYTGAYGGTDYWKETRPRGFAEMFRDCSDLCAEMMQAAGIEFDVFLSLALKQQDKRKDRTFNGVNRKLIPYATYVDPIPNHPPVKDPKTETTAAADPAPQPMVADPVGNDYGVE